MPCVVLLPSAPVLPLMMPPELAVVPLPVTVRPPSARGVERDAVTCPAI